MAKSRKGHKKEHKVEEVIVMAVNIRSLTAVKRDHLLRIANERKVHAICIQETWLTPKSKVVQGFGEQWRVFRKDRGTTKGGGVLVAVRSSVPIIRSRTRPDLECVGVEIALPNSSSLWVESLYVPPGPDGDGTQTPDLGRPEGRRFVFGDLNIPSRDDWVSDQVMQGWGLLTPDAMTHIRGGILDGCLTSEGDLRDRMTTEILPDWISDHACILYSVGQAASREYRKRPKKWVFAKADWDGFRSKVDSELRLADRPETASQMYSLLNRVIKKASADHIPRAPKQGTIPFWNDELECLRNVANASKRNAIAAQLVGGTDAGSIEAAAARAATQALHGAVQKAKNLSWKKFQINEGTNLSHGKGFWRVVKSLRSEAQNRDVEDAVRADSGELVTGFLADQAIREHILRQSREVRKQVRAAPVVQNPPVADILDSELTDPFSDEELREGLTKARASGAPGIDDITMHTLKNLPESGRNLLLLLANKIWTTGDMPGRLKMAKLVRLQKPHSGDAYAISAIRPVVIESTVARLVEALIARRLSKVIERHSLFPEEMHGFRPKKSTVSALRQFRDATRVKSRKHSDPSDPGRIAGCLMLDFSKFL